MSHNSNLAYQLNRPIQYNIADKSRSIMDVMILPPPIKSKSDSKHYRHIKLSNGLQALLISDENLQQDCDEFFETESEPEDTSSGKNDKTTAELAVIKNGQSEIICYSRIFCSI